MNPRIGKRSVINKEDRRLEAKVVDFVQDNTHKVIGIREEFVYLDDVKVAMNINALEQRMITKQWLLGILEKDYNKDYVINKIKESAELDRHRLVKY